MTLYADDPDIYRTYPIGDSDGQPIDFPAKVQVVDTDIVIDCSWEGDPGPARSLRVPLTDLPQGQMLFLRLLVPGDVDLDLGYVILE